MEIKKVEMDVGCIWPTLSKKLMILMQYKRGCLNVTKYDHKYNSKKDFKGMHTKLVWENNKSKDSFKTILTLQGEKVIKIGKKIQMEVGVRFHFLYSDNCTVSKSNKTRSVYKKWKNTKWTTITIGGDWCGENVIFRIFLYKFMAFNINN